MFRQYKNIMKNISYKLEDQNSIYKILEIIPKTNTWMRTPTQFDLSYWNNLFDWYSKWGNNFKIAIAYEDDNPVAFGTGLFSTSVPQWFFMQHFSIIPVVGLSKIYLDHGIHLTDTLIRHGESLGYYSYLGAWGRKHNSILDKIYSSPKKNTNYFRYIKLFEWYYTKNSEPQFNTHKVFAPGGRFVNDTVFNNFVLKPELRQQNF